jgi:hypothetical protein
LFVGLRVVSRFSICTRFNVLVPLLSVLVLPCVLRQRGQLAHCGIVDPRLCHVRAAFRCSVYARWTNAQFSEWRVEFQEIRGRGRGFIKRAVLLRLVIIDRCDKRYLLWGRYFLLLLVLQELLRTQLHSL